MTSNKSVHTHTHTHFTRISISFVFHCYLGKTAIYLTYLPHLFTAIFFRCPCWTTCISPECQERWMKLRTAVLSVVDTPAFEWFVLVLIFASSITLCFEDIYLDTNERLKQFLYWTNFVFSMVFVIEMVLKWMALGFTRYFTSFWTILDFIIVFVSFKQFFTSTMTEDTTTTNNTTI